MSVETRGERMINDKGTDWEKTYKTLLESANDGIIIINKKGEIIEFNPKAEKILGYTAEEIVGKSIEDLSPPEMLEAQRNGFKRVLKNGKTYGPGGIRETEWIGKDGGRISLEISQFTLGTEVEGMFMGAFIRDITDRKRFEEELKESEERYRSVGQTASDAIISTDGEGKIVFWNKAAEDIFGYSADEIVGRHLTILIPKRYWKINMDGLKLAITKGSADVFGKIVEGTMIRKDGTEFIAETSRAMSKTSKGLFFTAVIRDITKRSLMEEELKREKDFSKTIIEAADVLIVIVDLERKVMLFNKKAEEVTGYSREEVIGKELFETVFPEVDSSDFIKMSQDLLKGVNIAPRDIVFINKHGEERIVSNRGALLKDSEGNIMGVLGIALDITERREMQDKLVQSEKLRALGELAGGVAHDFNNMLAAILGRAQLMKMNMEDLPKGEGGKSALELKRGLEIIERTATDGAETVRRIQEFSRTRTDNKDFISLDINELVSHVLELTRPRWKDEGEFKGVKIQIKKELSSLPPIMGKPSELREVFTNLIHNSLDAMPQGGRIIIKTFKENQWICLKLEDTGIGMSAQVMENIFDPFYTTKGPKSTGLGMSVSYGIITRHRGSISVESIEGEGSSFTVKIPLKEVEAATEGMLEKLPEKKRKATILIIEDEDDIRNIIFDILTSNGHKVTTAPDGKRGIEIFKKGNFDLVFTDLGMPGMSGWEVASEVKKHDPEVIVAVITGWGIQLDNGELKNSNVDIIVNKPFKMERILNLTQEALEIKDKAKNEMGK
jgi:PAS domain S-box-containing protein